MIAIHEAMGLVQEKVYNILRNDNYIRNNTKGVFDDIKAKHPFPYIVFGDFSDTNFHTFDKLGRQIDFTLHVFSQYKGNKEINQIGARIKQLLDYTNIEVDDLHTVYLRYENGNFDRETNNPSVYRHYILDFVCIVQEKE